MRDLLGDGNVTLSLSTLDRNHYQLANILGKRVVTCTEAASRSILADAEFKQLVSGEEMALRQIWRETINYTPKVKLWWAVNELPQVLDSSDAVYRRVRIVSFHRAIPPERQDTALHDKLKAELPGIFNWALEGLMRLHRNHGFTAVAQMADQVQDYQAANDVEGAFLSDPDWIIANPEGEVKASDLYMAYRAGVRN